MTKNEAIPASSASTPTDPIAMLMKLLREIEQSPERFSDDAIIQAALCSQGALAKYEAPERGLKPVSLNHQKKLAIAQLGSFEVLDQARRGALTALLREKAKGRRGNTQTREGLIARIRQLEDERTALLQDLFLLQRAYDIRCLQARSYAGSADKSTQAQCAKEQRELDATFSLRKKEVPSDRVASLADARRVRE